MQIILLAISAADELIKAVTTVYLVCDWPDDAKQRHRIGVSSNSSNLEV
jgi:hypothetical protein